MMHFYKTRILKSITLLCKNGASCLVFPNQLICHAGLKGQISVETLNDILSTLEQNDFLDVVYTDKQGNTIYCITLHEKGKNYKINKRTRTKSLLNRIVITVFLAVISFLVGLILKSIF